MTCTLVYSVLLTSRVSPTNYLLDKIGSAREFAVSTDGRFFAARQQDQGHKFQIVFKENHSLTVDEVSKVNGQWADKPCVNTAISPSGETVCFSSNASNLGIANKTNSHHIYTWNRKSKQLKAITEGIPADLLMQYKALLSVSNSGNVALFETYPNSKIPQRVWIVEAGKGAQTLSKWLGLGEAVKPDLRGYIAADGEHFYAVVTDPIFNNGNSIQESLFITGTKTQGITTRIPLAHSTGIGAMAVSADGATVAYNNCEKKDKQLTISTWLIKAGVMNDFREVQRRIEKSSTHYPWGLAVSGDGMTIVYQTSMPGQRTSDKPVDQVVALNWRSGQSQIVSVDKFGNPTRVNSGLDATSMRSFASNFDGSQIFFSATFMKRDDFTSVTPKIYYRDLRSRATVDVP